MSLLGERKVRGKITQPRIPRVGTETTPNRNVFHPRTSRVLFLQDVFTFSVREMHQPQTTAWTHESENSRSCGRSQWTSIVEHCPISNDLLRVQNKLINIEEGCSKHVRNSREFLRPGIITCSWSLFSTMSAAFLSLAISNYHDMSG